MLERRFLFDEGVPDPRAWCGGEDGPPVDDAAADLGARHFELDADRGAALDVLDVQQLEPPRVVAQVSRGTGVRTFDPAAVQLESDVAGIGVREQFVISRVRAEATELRAVV